MIYDIVVKCNSTQLRMEIFFTLRGDLISQFAWLHFLYITRSVGAGILILFPDVTARMGLQRSEKCHKGIERCERRRNYSARKAGCLLWGLRMKKSTLQVRLNRRAVYDICRLQTADCRPLIADCKLNDTKNLLNKSDVIKNITSFPGF